MTFSRSREPTLKTMRKRAREQGDTEAKIGKIFAETDAEVGKMSDLEVSTVFLGIARNTVRADPDAIHDRQVLGAIKNHVRLLLLEDADVQATFKALRKPQTGVWVEENAETGERVERRWIDRMSKFEARTELFWALQGCVYEAAMGKPDRWPAVLELLRKGHEVSELFPDMPPNPAL
jgi:hypothetical protein